MSDTNHIHRPLASIILIGPCEEGSMDSGFEFQTDCGFEIQISKWQDSGFKESNHFSEIHFSNMQGFWIQI